MGTPPMTSQRAIPLLTPFVAKRECGHPTRTRTRVYRVPNMHSDHNAKDPGSLLWQSEQILMCSDGTLSQCPHLQEAHPCASRTQVFLAHPPTVLFPFRAPHTQVLHTSMGSLTQGSTYLGVPHTVLRARFDDLTASHPTFDTICSEGRA